tara:strand:- start:1979 stop:2536 length:558 start_codon:yes stop_codon:yes gene_type:complete
METKDCCSFTLLCQGTVIFKCDQRAASNRTNMCSKHSVKPIEQLTPRWEKEPSCPQDRWDDLVSFLVKERELHARDYPDEIIVFPNFCYGVEEPSQSVNSLSNIDNTFIKESVIDPESKKMCTFVPQKGKNKGVQCTNFISKKSAMLGSTYCSKHCGLKSQKTDKEELLGRPSGDMLNELAKNVF